MQVGIFELGGKDPLDLAFRHEAQAHRGLAEANALFFLEQQDFFGAFGADQAGIDQHGADLSIETRGHGCRICPDRVEIAVQDGDVAGRQDRNFS